MSFKQVICLLALAVLFPASASAGDDLEKIMNRTLELLSQQKTHNWAEKDLQVREKKLKTDIGKTSNDGTPNGEIMAMRKDHSLGLRDQRLKEERKKLEDAQQELTHQMKLNSAAFEKIVQTCPSCVLEYYAKLSSKMKAPTSRSPSKVSQKDKGVIDPVHHNLPKPEPGSNSYSEMH